MSLLKNLYQKKNRNIKTPKVTNYSKRRKIENYEHEEPFNPPLYLPVFHSGSSPSDPYASFAFPEIMGQGGTFMAIQVEH